MDFKINSIVMAGGRGTRFWPESTSKKPKQYLNLLGDKSLLEQTLDRFSGIVEKDNRYIVTVKDQDLLVASSSVDKIGDNGVIFEPSGRNTAPCILLSIAYLLKNGHSKDEVVAIVPSDHVILNTNSFREVILDASKLASSHSKIVTIGIPPTFPHTGYGYIQMGSKFEALAYNVEEFKEKPSFEIAKEYVASGKYSWNAGMFVATIETLIEEFKSHAPETYDYFDSLMNSIGDFEELKEVYNKIPANSIDYAIMEKSKNVVVIKARFDWNDLGSWDAMESVMEKTNGNTIISSNKVYTSNADGNIIYAPNKNVSLINVNDLVVVSNDHSVLVVPKKDSQKVKECVPYFDD